MDRCRAHKAFRHYVRPRYLKFLRARVRRYQRLKYKYELVHTPFSHPEFPEDPAATMRQASADLVESDGNWGGSWGDSWILSQETDNISPLIIPKCLPFIKQNEANSVVGIPALAHRGKYSRMIARKVGARIRTSAGDEDTDVVQTMVETIGLSGADGDLNLVASLRACFLQSDARENGDPNRGSLNWRREEGAREVWEGHNKAEKPQNTTRASGTAWWSHRKALERSGRGRDERGGGGGVGISSASSAGSASGTGKVRPAREVVWKRQQKGSATRSATGGDRSYRGVSSVSSMSRRASVSIVGDVYTALRRRKEVRVKPGNHRILLTMARERVREARGCLGNGESVGLARKLLPVTWFAGAMRRRAVHSTLGDLTAGDRCSSSPSNPQRLSPTLHAPGFLINPITCMTGAVDIEGPATAAMWPAIEGRLRPQWGGTAQHPDFEVDATMRAAAEVRDGVFATGVGSKDECRKAPTGDEGKVGEGGGDSVTEDAGVDSLGVCGGLLPLAIRISSNLLPRYEPSKKRKRRSEDPEGVPNTHGVERAVSGCGMLDMVLMAMAGAKGRDASHSCLLFMSSKTNPYNMEDLHRGERYCSFDFMIPKPHSYAHHAICQYDYSCTRTRQTDGESVERTWAVISKADMGKPEGAFQRESRLRALRITRQSCDCRTCR
ncbi:hypothetical protein B0H14DRAFT_2644045 [Mycena olivaceomarginata]|nr:hypothetical protein B0H14DRAFT_2644045 [Mycena olivaceomarginata]